MKTLATLALLLSVPGLHFAPPTPTTPPASGHAQARQVRKGGKWYFAQNGHAVFCFGPVITVPEPEGGLQKVATFCQDGQTMVPLKD